jgi:hypothetical protein
MITCEVRYDDDDEEVSRLHSKGKEVPSWNGMEWNGIEARGWTD